ncbi:MAG: OmpA family protein [Janthinobacterium lividum]
MADLDVQPKKNNSWWLWLLLLLIALGLLFFFLRGCNNKSATQTGGADSVVAATTATSGSQIDFNSPKEAYEEMTDASISVRGNKDYTIYGLGEDILFDKDNNTLKSSAETQLKLIAASLGKRFKGADLSVYGHTDSTGTAAHNKELGAERAEAVRSWFIKNGTVADKISVHSFGESNPVASNETAEGRKQNRSVAIVATPVKP